MLLHLEYYKVSLIPSFDRNCCIICFEKNHNFWVLKEAFLMCCLLYDGYCKKLKATGGGVTLVKGVKKSSEYQGLRKYYSH